jgi:hypothetical protein
MRSAKTGDLPEDINYRIPDLTYLNEISGGDETFIKDIITYFLESCPGLLEVMRESNLSGDREKLRFAAHKLLPQLTFVGILSAIPDVEKIERGAKLSDDLTSLIDRAIKTINYGIGDLKKMV